MTTNKHRIQTFVSDELQQALKEYAVTNGLSMSQAAASLIEKVLLKKEEKQIEKEICSESEINNRFNKLELQLLELKEKLSAMINTFQNFEAKIINKRKKNSESLENIVESIPENTEKDGYIIFSLRNNKPFSFWTGKDFNVYIQNAKWYKTEIACRTTISRLVQTQKRIGLQYQKYSDFQKKFEDHEEAAEKIIEMTKVNNNESKNEEKSDNETEQK